MSYLPTALLAPSPQGSSPAPAGRVRRCTRADGQFPSRRWARLVNRVWAGVQAELHAEPPAAAEPGSIQATEHRRPIEQEAEVADPARVERLRQRTGLLVAQELAAQRQAAKRCEAARVAELGAHDRKAAQDRAAAKAGILQSDLGPDGVAMRARPDVDPLIALKLSERQAEAADWLRRYWRDAMPALALPQGWGDGGHKAGERHLTHDEYLAAEAAWKNYQAWMELLRRDFGWTTSAAVLALVIQCEPHQCALLVPPALDYLAAHMGLS